ncbi:MAG: DUF4097 family beta strand repeat-containing protein [Limnochordales bacterium]|nr:hypothetical protein [Bacillota bacterium]REJ37135.1 MAG: hypothetical protein DIU82_01835 [Bacillota bacterium]
MGFKRTLILGFLILSAIAVWDLTSFGVDDFIGIVESDLVRIDGQQGRLPAQNPDYEEHRQLEPLAGVRQVAIEGLAGQLDVVRSETDQVTVEYSIRLWGDGSPQQLAEAAAVLSEQVASGLVQEGDSVRLAVRRSADLPAGVRAMRVAVRLAVPDGTSLAATLTGDARVEGIAGAVDLQLGGGNVAVRRVQGPVEVDGNFGNVSLEQLSGPVHVDLTGGNVTGWDIAGSVTGRVNMGELDLDRIGGDVDFTVERGAARVKDVGGNVKLTGSFGEARIDGVQGDVTAELSFGSLRVRGVRRAADVSVRFGDLELVLEGEGGWSVQAAAERGSLETTLPLQREGSERSPRLSGVIGDGAYPVRVEVQQGAGRLVRR